MTLNGYLSVLPTGEQAQFARSLGIPPAYLSQLSHGFRRPGIEIAARIERETGGAVTVEELRPDIDWRVIRGSPAKAVDTKEQAP